MNQESSSPWNSWNGLLPWCYSSKVMTVRICGGYKVTVNRVVKVDSCPLTQIDDLIASLAGGKLFSKLDLAHTYQQIPLAEE